MDKNTVKECKYFKTEINLLVNIKIINFINLANFIGKMDLTMLEILQKG